ncbi:MAG: DUF1674 domain-containing protein [Geminicoccaceae bacterium]|nr:MAG: DUF1674 domain-containing protein [Geminicoccaceae bacterium]
MTETKPTTGREVPASQPADQPGRAAPAPGSTPTQPPGETGGPKGPEPTRFGDWEKNGRCFDF